MAEIVHSGYMQPFSAALVEGILRRSPGREAAQLGAKVKMAFAMCACEKSGGPPLETSQQ